MNSFTDKQRIDHCLLLIIAIKQMFEDTSALNHPAALEYAERCIEFFNYTMHVCSAVDPDRLPTLTLVE